MSQQIQCGGCRLDFCLAGVVEAQTLGGDMGHGIREMWPEAVHVCLQCLAKCKTLYAATQPSPSVAPSNQPHPALLNTQPGGEGIEGTLTGCAHSAEYWDQHLQARPPQNEPQILIAQ